MYEIRHSQVYEEALNYSGQVSIIEGEFTGLPGMSGLIKEAIETTFSLYPGQELMLLMVWQDSEPLFDKYKVYIIGHGQSVLVIVAIILAALMALALLKIVWNVRVLDWVATGLREVVKTVGLIAEEIATQMVRIATGVVKGLASELWPVALAALAGYAAYQTLKK